MSTQPTDWQLSELMRALAAAEHLLATAPTPPCDIDLKYLHAPQATQTSMQFTTEAEVRGFAEATGAEVAVSTHLHTDGPRTFTYTLVEARGDLDGVSYRGWTHVYPAADEPDIAEQQDEDLEQTQQPQEMAPSEAEVNEQLVTIYRAGDGQEFTHTGEWTDEGKPLYAEAGIPLPTHFQSTADQLCEQLGSLTAVQSAPAVTA